MRIYGSEYWCIKVNSERLAFQDRRLKWARIIFLDGWFDAAGFVQKRTFCRLWNIESRMITMHFICNWLRQPQKRGFSVNDPKWRFNGSWERKSCVSNSTCILSKHSIQFNYHFAITVTILSWLMDNIALDKRMTTYQISMKFEKFISSSWKHIDQAFIAQVDLHIFQYVIHHSL